TQSVYGDRSTENHLLFIDKLGRELVHVRAQRDKLMTAAHDLSYTIHQHLDVSVGGNEVRNVTVNRTTTIDGFETENLNSGQTRTVTTNGRKTTITGLVKDVIDGPVNYTQKGDRTITATGDRKFDLLNTDNMSVSQDGTWTFEKNLTENLKIAEHKIGDDADIKVKSISEEVKSSYYTRITSGNRLLKVDNYMLDSDSPWNVKSKSNDIMVDATKKFSFNAPNTKFKVEKNVLIAGLWSVNFDCTQWNDDVNMTTHVVASKIQIYTSSYRSETSIEVKLVGAYFAGGPLKSDFYAFGKIDKQMTKTKAKSPTVIAISGLMLINTVFRLHS
ncbi:MAG: hypothetical protein Q4G44_09285, partial [Alcaligenaceae bacterium]|nr:hypothetical protein [Alcaligenaceae bacterium]